MSLDVFTDAMQSFREMHEGIYRYIHLLDALLQENSNLLKNFKSFIFQTQYLGDVSKSYYGKELLWQRAENYVITSALCYGNAYTINLQQNRMQLCAKLFNVVC